MRLMTARYIMVKLYRVSMGRQAAPSSCTRKRRSLWQRSKVCATHEHLVRVGEAYKRSFNVMKLDTKAERSRRRGYGTGLLLSWMAIPVVVARRWHSS